MFWKSIQFGFESVDSMEVAWFGYGLYNGEMHNMEFPAILRLSLRWIGVFLSYLKNDVKLNVLFPCYNYLLWELLTDFSI